MNMNILLVIISLLFNLLSGGTTSNAPTINQDKIAGINPYLLQMMYMYGGNIDMDRAYNREYDQTYYLDDDGYRSYGWEKGSYVRVHGNLNSGIYFDFNIKMEQQQQEVVVSTPVEGLSIVTSQYSSGDAGYSFSIGPVNLQTALQLFNMASYYMVPSSTN